LAKTLDFQNISQGETLYATGRGALCSKSRSHKHAILGATAKGRA